MAKATAHAQPGETNLHRSVDASRNGIGSRVFVLRAGQALLCYYLAAKIAHTIACSYCSLSLSLHNRLLFSTAHRRVGQFCINTPCIPAVFNCSLSQTVSKLRAIAAGQPFVFLAKGSIFPAREKEGERRRLTLTACVGHNAFISYCALYSELNAFMPIHPLLQMVMAPLLRVERHQACIHICSLQTVHASTHSPVVRPLLCTAALAG
eukprot:531365-Pelagomonas_calceolata.AAC.4